MLEPEYLAPPSSLLGSSRLILKNHFLRGLEANFKQPKSFEAGMFRCQILDRLCNGFAQPNASSAWTVLFSELSPEDWLWLINERNETRPATPLVNDNFSRSVLINEFWWSGLFVKGSYYEPYHVNKKALAMYSRESSDRIANLPWCLVGVQLSKDYLALSGACSLILGRPDDDQLRQMARPALLKERWNEYIDLLVLANNRVQLYTKNARDHAFSEVIAFMRAMNVDENLLDKVSRSPIAVMFAAAFERRYATDLLSEAA